MPNPKNNTVTAEPEEKLKYAPKQKETADTEPGIAKYAGKVERIKLDPNLEAAKYIQELKGNLEPSKQQEGLTAMHTALTQILVKLVKKGVDISKIEAPTSLEAFVHSSDIEMSLLEAVALRNLERILKETGPTAQELNASWKDCVDAVKMTKTGSISKYLRYLKDDPISTIALTMAGAAGICLAYQGLKTLVQQFFAGEKDKETSKKTVSWFKKEIMIPVAIMAAGAILGREMITRILADCGLDYFDLKNMIKRGKAFALNERQKLRKAGEQVRDALTLYAGQEVLKNFGEAIKFSEVKARLLAFLPMAPEWLKNLTLEQIVQDLGIDPKDETAWNKYKGAGGASLLLYHWFTRKHKGDKVTAKLLKSFVEKEGGKVEDEPAKPGSTASSEYSYEMMPIKDAWKNYRKELCTAFAGVTKFVKENPGTVTVGATYLASFESIRSVSADVMKGGFQGFVDLAKIPFKTVANFPLTSLFAVSAVIAAESRFNLKDQAGNIMIPKDSENLKKFIMAKIEYAKEHGEDWILQVPAFDEADIEKVIYTIHHPETLREYIGKAEEVLANVLKTTLDDITLSRERLIQEANYKGFNIFYTDVVAFLQPEEKEGSVKHRLYTDLLREIETTKIMLKKGDKLTRSHIESKFKPITDQLSIELIYDESGYVMWHRLKESGNGMLVIDPDHSPKRLCIDPDRPLKEAADLAQKMVVEESTQNALGKIIEVGLIDKARMIAGDILFEDAETEEQAAKVLQRKFRGGWAIAHAGKQLLIYEPAKGIWHKYYSGPFNILPDIVRLAAGSKDISATEVAIEYGQGIIPVYLLGQASALLKLDFAKMGIGKPLFRAALYPIELAKDASVFTFRHVILNMLYEKQPLKAIFSDPKMAVFSEFKRTSHSWQRILGSAKEVRHEREILARMYEAKKVLHQAIYKTIRVQSRRRYITEAVDLLKATGEIERIMEKMEISSETEVIREAIAKLDRAIVTKENKLTAILESAAGKARQGKEAVRTAAKAEKLVETSNKLSQARKAADVTKDAATASRKGFVTAEEAARIGIRVEEVASKGGKMLKFVRVAGRVFVVVDAVLSVYDVYDQACELGKTLSVEYVETGSILAAMKKISEHGETMSASTRELEAKDNQKVMNEKDIKIKLYGARELASRLQICAQQYGITRRSVSGDSTFSQIWDTGAMVLSELTLAPTVMRIIYGSESDKLKASEDKTIEMNIRYANELTGQLKRIAPSTPEILATIDALEASVALANRAIQMDRIPSEPEIKTAKEKLNYARARANEALTRQNLKSLPNPQ